MPKLTSADFVRNLGYGFGGAGILFAVAIYEMPALLAPIPIVLTLLAGLILSAAFLAYEASNPERLKAARLGPRTPSPEEVRNLQFRMANSSNNRFISMVIVVALGMAGLVIYSLISG